MLKQITMTMVIVILITTMMTTGNAYAGKSIISNIADGYDAGKAQGKNDYREGNGWNDNCPSGVGTQYCIGWVSGYNIGYGSLKIAGDFLVAFAVQDVQASIGSDEFCAQNPGHFACDNENDNDSDDDGKSDEDENSDNDNFDEPSGCYAAGFEDGQTGPFDTEVYHDNCEGEGKYYQGFIDGCMSVEGNTRDVCESATDA